MSRRLPWFAPLGALVVAGAVGACAELELGCDDLSGMLDGPGGITVTHEEHPTGWGQTRCFTCHSVERIHVMNCTGLDEVDLAEIRAIVDDQGTASCASCHGDNGVEP